MTDKSAAASGGGIVLRGRRIREDANGLLCLNDIYQIAQRPRNQAPTDWGRLKTSANFMIAVWEKTMGKSHSKAKIEIKSVYYVKMGRDGGTFAHALIAAEYAGYLNPKLRIEIVDVWLRYRAGDPTLADEILQHASDEGNKWVAARAMGRVERRKFTDALKAAGVTGPGYGRCTNAIYGTLFGRTAKQLKLELGVTVTRDGMDIPKLSQVMLSEGMAAERIDYEVCQGDRECAEASKISAGYVREAVEREKASRVRRRLRV